MPLQALCIISFRTAPLQTRKGIDTTKMDKNPARASYLAVRAPHGLFKGCLGSQNPYGARKLIMHALKLYGPRTGRQNSYGTAPCGPREWTYGFCSKQPGNSPYGARECDVTEASLIKDGWRIYASLNWAIICSGNGLPPEDAKPLPEPMLTHCQLDP